MALCVGTMSAVLNPSLCKIGAPLIRTRVVCSEQNSNFFPQQKHRASLTAVPCSLRSGSSSSLQLGLGLGLSRFGMDKFQFSRSRTERQRGRRAAAPILSSHLSSTEAFRWIFTVSAVVLMLSKNTGVHKSFLVPLLALEAPVDVVSWIRHDYGLWTAFIVFIVRLFYPIPGEMELPLLFVLLVIIAPYQALNIRGTQAGMVISIAIAAYLIYQHYTSAGGLKKAFEQGPLIASIAALCLICIPCWFLIQGFIF